MDALLSTYRGYHLFNDDLNNLPQNTKTLVNTINQYSFCVAEEDQEFKNALERSDILLPDGVGIVAAIKATTGLNIRKISGTDLHQQQLEKLNKNKGKCFYLGSSEATLKKIKDRLKTEYPNVTAGFYSPPFKKTFSDGENAEMLKKINEFNPDVLFIGMTAPKQEKWAWANKDKINAKLICSIGAVFDFFAGTIKRPSDFWIKMKLEWFVRLCREPKRMWKRYLYYGPVFVYILLKEIIIGDLAHANHLGQLQNH